MADGDFNLATIWASVVPETSKVGPAMEDAGKEGKRRFGDGFDASGIGSEIGVVLGKGLSTSAGSAALEHLPKSLGDAVGSMANQVGNEGKTLGDALGTELGSAVGSIARDQLPTSITGAVDSIKDRVGNEGKSLGEAIGIELGAAAADAIRDHLPDRVKTSIDSVKNQVGNEGKTLGDALGTELGSAVGDAFRDSAAGKTVNEFFAAVNTASDHVRGGIENVHTAIAGLKSGDAGTALDGISGSLESINSLAQTFGGDVHEWTGPLDEVLSKTGSIVDDFGNMKDGISEFASLIEADAPAIATALNEALGPIAIVATALYTIYNGLPGIGGGMKDILGAPDPTKGFNSPVQGPPGIPVTGPKPLTLPPGLGGTGPAVPPGYTATPGSLDPFAALLPPGMAPPPGVAGGPAPLPVLAPPDMPDGTPTPPIPPPMRAAGPTDLGGGPAPSSPSLPAPSGGGGGASPIPRSFVPSSASTASSPSDLRRAGGNIAALYALASSLQGTPYSQPLRNDCSGMVSRLATAALGMTPSVQFSTVNEGEWLFSHGFQPGMGGPGDLSIGWYDHGGGNAGHTAATLPGGEHAESGGSHGSFLVGPGAAGADNPEFTNHAHLAMSGRGASMGGDRGAVGPTGEQHDPLYVTQSNAGVGAGSADQAMGSQLGSGLVNGVLQEFGLDGSVFKSFGGSSNPLQFGITKLASGLINSFGGMFGGKGGGDGAALSFGGGGGIPGMAALGGLLPHPAATGVPIGPGGAQNVPTGDTHIYNAPVGGITVNGGQGTVEDWQHAMNGVGTGLGAADTRYGGAGGVPNGGTLPTPPGG